MRGVSQYLHVTIDLSLYIVQHLEISKICTYIIKHPRNVNSVFNKLHCVSIEADIVMVRIIELKW